MGQLPEFWQSVGESPNLYQFSVRPSDMLSWQVKGFPEIKIFYNGRIGYQVTGSLRLFIT